MFVDDPSLLKRRRLEIIDSTMEASSAQAKIADMREKFGREIRVFETSSASLKPTRSSGAEEESDGYYELTAADYYRLVATKKEDNSLKTRKLREAEQAARRAKLTKAVIRVRFPDNHTFEATFHPSEKIQSLIDLLKKVVAQPDTPFYLYTTPPKKQIKDFSQDFYAAGFIPGAIVYFANDVPKVVFADDAAAISTPYLSEEILSLKDVEVMTKAEEPVDPSSESATSDDGSVPVEQEPKPTEKKSTKPKWFKM